MAETQTRRPERTKPVEFWTLIIAVAALLGNVSHFAFFGWTLYDLDRRKKEIEVNLAEAESVEMQTQILAPELVLKTDGRSVPICPVYVYITNTGQTPVKLQELQFRVYWASIDDAIVQKTIDVAAESTVILPTAVGGGNNPAEQNALVGFIVPESQKWAEIPELRQTVRLANGFIPSGGTRVERRHVFVSRGESRVLTKVEVTLKTAKSTQRWYGFVTEPALCSPSPFSSTASDTAAPAQAPLEEGEGDI